ncbi:MAG: hypothetical protein ACYC91_05625 [Solirubrobacteraceae bacterium]
MSFPKLACACGLATVALAACGSTSKPLAGSAGAAATARVARGKVDDPRRTHLKCLEQDHLNARDVGSSEIRVGIAPGGPLIVFTPTPGAAQEDQISGLEQGAEVIGSALLYPGQAGDKLLQKIENCTAKGVSG